LREAIVQPDTVIRWHHLVSASGTVSLISNNWFAPVIALGFTITSTELPAVGFKMPEGKENKDTPRDGIYQGILLVVAALLMAITLFGAFR